MALRSLLVFAVLFVSLAPLTVSADCWLIEGDKGYVWLAICSQNQPPFETIPPHINSTVHDLRLNDNKLKAVLFTSMYRFTNLTDLNLTKNDIGYIEDGAFASQANLQILQLGYNKLTNLTEGMLRGLGRLQCLFLQHNLLEIISTNTFWECPSLSSLDLSSNKLARLDPSTFVVLNRLTVCELAANPFHCGCDLFSFLTWLEAFNNVTHTYDRLQCETPRDMFGYPLLSPVPGHGRNARTVLSTRCRDGVIIPGMPSQLPDQDGSGLGLDNTEQGFYHQPNTSSTADALNKNQITIVTQAVSQYSVSLRVQIPEPYHKMYVLSQYNHTLVTDKPLKKKTEVIMLDKLQPHTNYTYCVASVSKFQRYNHTCMSFTTRAAGPEDHRANPSTTTHYIMTIVGCLFGMLLVLGFVYYCLRRRRAQEEKEKAISVKKTILEMRYGPEAAAAVSNDPGAMQRLQDQAQHHGAGTGKQSASPGAGMLPGTGNSGAGRLSALPQGEKMSSAFSESPAGGAGGGKGNYMDVRTAGLVAEARETAAGGGAAHVAAETVVDMRNAEEDDDADDNDPDEDVHGSNSEISTIAKEVDKVNQIINNCIDALKLDASSSASVPTGAENIPIPQPPSYAASQARNLLPMSPASANEQLIKAPSPKVHAKMHPQPSPKVHAKMHPQPSPKVHAKMHPQTHLPPHPHPSMAPVPLVMPLSERPGISGGGFLTPPYRDPPPANAVRPLQRQLSADAKHRLAAPTSKNPRGYSVDEQRGDPPKYQEKTSPLACKKGERGCSSNGINGGGVSVNGASMGCSNGSGSGGGGPKVVQTAQHLEVQPDYHSSEHRHSFPALYYDNPDDSPNSKFLKPQRSKRDAPAGYAQLSPARHHNYNSGYSSSPEYSSSSESTLRIWERFKPYRKSPREEAAAYIAAGHALRKKVQFAKDEDLHDILDYWKGVSAQQKL